MKRRDFLKKGSFLGLALLSLKSSMVSAKNLPERLLQLGAKPPVLPPGALGLDDFREKCTSCNLCVSKCKGNVIQPANSEYSTVHMDFNKGACLQDCTACNNVCPTGALKKLSLEQKQNLRLLTVGVKTDKCVGCKACMRACSYKAISFDDKTYKAKINQKLCKGCGACVKACPLKAIDSKATV